MTVSTTEPLTPGLDDLDRPLTDRERRRWLLRPALSGYAEGCEKPERGLRGPGL